jgi:hypothetical protein
MKPSPETPSDLFLRFSRQKLAALLLVTLLVNGAALALVLTPTGPAWSQAANVSLVLVALAILVIVQFAFRGRRWSANTPQVQIALRDEWLRSNMDRATRGALVVVLLAQFPLAVPLGFLAELEPPRGPIVMAMATVLVGLVTQMGLFLWFDREQP